MAEDDPNRIVLQRWKPKPLGRNDRSKRKAKHQIDPWADAGRYRRASGAELDAIIKDMGFEVTDQVKVVLLMVLNDYVFNLGDGMRRLRDMPPTSEAKELLEGLHGNIKKVLSSMDLDQSADEIRKQVGLSRLINPTVLHRLVCASGLEGWEAVDHITHLVKAVAELGVLAANGSAQLKGPPSSVKTERPERMISIVLAQLFRDVFNREPTRYSGGPWLKFLKWGLKNAGFSMTQSDDLLRKLPISQPS